MITRWLIERLLSMCARAYQHAQLKVIVVLISTDASWTNLWAKLLLSTTTMNELSGVEAKWCYRFTNKWKVSSIWQDVALLTWIPRKLILLIHQAGKWDISFVFLCRCCKIIGYYLIFHQGCITFSAVLWIDQNLQNISSHRTPKCFLLPRTFKKAWILHVYHRYVSSGGE